MQEEQKTMEYKLLSPVQIGKATVKNRVVFPSMCHDYCDADGLLTERLEEYVRVRAQAGVGLIILPGNPYGKGSTARMALTEEKHLAGWEKLADICHQYDCKLFVQLHPSTYHHERDHDNTPASMDGNDIAFFVMSYAQGAYMARKAGLDGVEIHGAHAHEVAQFLSPYYNRRTDGYGGDYRGRSRFAVEMIEEIKNRTAGEVPLIFRISASEKIEGGREVEETVQVAPLLIKAGADALHVSVGTPISEEWISAPMDLPCAFNIDDVSKVKAVSSVPVIAVNRIISPHTAEEIIAQGKADLVALGRAQLADPDFVAKILSREPIRPCLGCNQGCRSPFGKDIFCTQNPRTGREHSLTYRPADQERRNRKILIAGAGVAGLEAGIVLTRRGYRPVVFEAKDVPGGLIRLSMKPPHKEDMGKMIECRMEEARALGLEIRLGTPLTVQKVKDEKADVVIVATGSEPLSVRMEDRPSGHVYLADDVFERGLAEKDVAVLGGGLVGCEIAETLAAQGKNVTIFEMGREIAHGLSEFRRIFLFRRLAEGGVDVRLDTKVEKIDLPVIHVSNGKYCHSLKGFEAVVMALGRRSVTRLAEELQASLSGVELHIVGDAKEPRLAIDATCSAALCASEI
jgi:2,4-dienoyl-CoA reductase-like NADH-dependent reductase (Old Yellow Enzyme family)/thioredoxin reductase